MKMDIRRLYLYLVSFIGLLVMVFGFIRLVDLGIKVFVFKNADQYSYISPRAAIMEGKEPNQQLSEEEIQRQEEEQKKIQEQEMMRQRQRETSGALSMILVGFPLYFYHWRKIQHERE